MIPSNFNNLSIHSCLRESHKCDQVCSICPNKICNKKAGHDKIQEHLCSDKCFGTCEIGDCKNACMKSFKHDQQHNCQNDHPCKEKCKYCDKNCQKDHSIPHIHNHDCKEIYCTHDCSLCTSRYQDTHNKSKDKGHHFCDQKHYCQEKCDDKGICKIEYEFKEVIWKSQISEFQYTKYKPKNIGKQQCNLEIPPGKLKHDGKHSCKNETEKQFHNCNQQCPECNTFCDLRYGLQGVHSSDKHRNKENQIFTQKEGNLEQIEIYESKDTIRKYQIGDLLKHVTKVVKEWKSSFSFSRMQRGQQDIQKKKIQILKNKILIKFCVQIFGNLINGHIQLKVKLIILEDFQKNDYEYCEQDAWHSQNNKISSHGFFCTEDHKKNQIQEINIAFVTLQDLWLHIQICVKIKTKAQKNMILDVSFAVIFYKEHDPPYKSSQKILDIQDFTSENVVIQFLNKLTADGGEEGPEAVLDGFDTSFKLNWTDIYVKLLYLIADAPPHGKQYHNYTDSFPESCPCKLNQNDILQKLWKKKVLFKILQLNQSINGMITEFKKDFQDLEVTESQDSDKVNSFQNLIVGQVCKYLVHNEITYYMKK
ncbi:unnamed protein product [Paramecium sonneborni]|uniref:Uncharacterized protein n=1 Tax=Paramecium sonneborni TaxID=65129 RepID=A0A8S1RDL4_9CILI|nr:unnamed protein product [Paramecium sonneborni]